MFIGPAAIAYATFLLGPMVHSLWTSLLSRSGSFVGLENYEALLGGGEPTTRFWAALRHNVRFFVIHMVFQNGLGLGLAALLTSKALKGGHVYRTLIFLPALLSPVIVGFIWKLILNPIWNVRAAVMEPIGLGRWARTPLLNDQDTVLNTIALISVWQFTGIAMILFYTALIRIPDAFVEAAKLDGASTWQIFRHVKLPLIRPTIGVVTILTFLGNFNSFDLVFTIKGADAGPDFASDLLGTLYYRTSFGQSGGADLTAGATVGGATFVIILLGSLVYFGWQSRTSSYDF